MSKEWRGLSIQSARLLIVFSFFLVGAFSLRTRLASGQSPASVPPQVQATPTPCVCPSPSPASSVQTPDEESSRQAFLAASTVLLHARCVNCHAAGNVPLQGDNSITHKGEKLQRGTDGKGVAPFKCTLCHKAANKDTGPILAPGAPDWRMPTQAAPLVFEKRTPAQLCLQFKDIQQAGGRTPAQIVEHVKKDALVTWAWKPGLKRALPPLSHEDFVKQMEEWATKGAACPQ